MANHFRRESALGPMGLRKESVAQEGALSLGLRRPSEGFLILLEVFSSDRTLTKIPDPEKDMCQIFKIEVILISHQGSPELSQLCISRCWSAGHIEKTFRRVGSAKTFGGQWGASK